jgi:hypothetical protein
MNRGMSDVSMLLGLLRSKPSCGLPVATASAPRESTIRFSQRSCPALNGVSTFAVS